MRHVLRALSKSRFESCAFALVGEPRGKFAKSYFTAVRTPKQQINTELGE